MKYYCNPINVPYAYSFKKEPRDNFKLTVNREAADPSMVMYGEKYYLFASMTGSVWVSEDMVSWKAYSLLFFVKRFSLKKASEFPVFSKGFSLL